MKKILLFIISLLLVVPFINVKADRAIKVYVFYGDGCGYCAALHSYLDNLELDPEYNYMFDVEYLEVWSNSTNSAILTDVGNYFNERIDGVPFYVIGEEYFSGFSVEGSSAGIKQAIKDAYNDSNYKDVVAPFIRSNKVDNDSDFGDTDDTINENEPDNNKDNSNDDKEISNKEDKEDSNIISFSKDDLIEYGKYILVMLIVIAFIVILAKLFL